MERITITVHHFVTAVTIILTLTALILSSLAISGHIDYKDNSIEGKALKVDEGFEHAILAAEKLPSFKAQSAVDGVNGLAADTAKVVDVTVEDLLHLTGHASEATESGAHMVIDTDGLALKSADKKYLTLTVAANADYPLIFPAAQGTVNQVLKLANVTTGQLAFSDPTTTATIRFDQIQPGTGTAKTVTHATGMTFETTTGNITIDAAAIATLDGATQAVITSNNNTADSIELNSANGGIHITADDTVDLDATTLDVDTSGAIHLDADLASNFTTSAGALTLSGAGGVTVTSTGGQLSLDGTGQTIDINATTLDVDTTGAIQLDADTASNFTTSAGALTLNGAAGVVIQGNTAEIDITTTGAVDINSGAFTIDGSTLSIDSTDTTNLTMTSNDAGIKVMTIEAINNTGSANIDINASDAVTIDAGAASNFTTTAGALTLSGAGGITVTTAGNTDITIDPNGTGNLSLGTAVNATTALAGNAITITSAGDTTLSSTGGSINITYSNVGIGTTNPSELLHIVENSGQGTPTTFDDPTVMVLQRNTVGNDCSMCILAANDANSTINFGDVDNRNVGHISYDHTNDKFDFRVGASSSRMTLDSTGNLKVSGGINSGIPIVMADATSTDLVHATHSGRILVLPIISQDSTYNLPTPVSPFGEHYHFIYGGNAAETDEFILRTKTTDSSVLIQGSVNFIITDPDATADNAQLAAIANGTEVLTIPNAAAIDVHFVSISASLWYVWGTVSSVTTPAWST